METQYENDDTKLREWEEKLGEINDLTSKEAEAKEKLEAARRQVDKLKTRVAGLKRNWRGCRKIMIG